MEENIVKIEVLVYLISYSTPKEEVLSLRVEDSGLDQAMEQLASQIKEGGKEVFSIDHNIIFMEDGYVVGIYEEYIKTLLEIKQAFLN